MLAFRADRLRAWLCAAASLLGCAALAGCKRDLTVVSIEFDDVYADQAVAVPILAAHGMRATFYVNSGEIDKPGYLTRSELRAYEGAYNEIGGHTVDHPLLPSLTREEQAREVCDDRRDLRAMGLTVDTFAYPSGAYDAGVEAVVRACGYESARAAGGLCASPSLLDRILTSCPEAETLPPADRFALRDPGSVRRERLPDGIRALVSGAETHGGGWVQLVFHHVCDHCNDYSITKGEFSDFIDWLARERDAGRVRVLTAREVVQGDV
jgi:peptidoglycan/xylan/chitin deacetylase (PgdA/CDA1 family)